MQFSGVNWQAFGPVLAALLVFGLFYSLLVRWMAKKGVEGQTAWMVVIGVVVTGIGFAVIVGLEMALVMAVCFAASGFFMVIEYVSRVEAARRKDHEQAQKQSKDL